MAKLSWRSLNATLNTLTEEQVKAMLDDELNGKRRLVIARRLHQRFAALRTSRERAEILRKVGQNG